jgi:hypothetical protein
LNAEAEDADDLSIADECKLYRRIPGNQIKPDRDGRLRPISGAFNNSSGVGGTMSISLDDTMKASGIAPEDLVADHAETYLASITARLARHEEQRLRRSPEPEEPAHGEVVGPKSAGRRKRFAKGSEWAVPPPAAA